MLSVDESACSLAVASFECWAKWAGLASPCVPASGWPSEVRCLKELLELKHLFAVALAVRADESLTKHSRWGITCLTPLSKRRELLCFTIASKNYSLSSDDLCPTELVSSQELCKYIKFKWFLSLDDWKVVMFQKNLLRRGMQSEAPDVPSRRPSR